MGCDGHIVITSCEEFEKANPGVLPSDIGLYTGKVLGVEACWGYYGDNLFEPNYGKEYIGIRYVREDDRLFAIPLSPGQVDAAMRAAEWFNCHAESHEVWT